MSLVTSQLLGIIFFSPSIYYRHLNKVYLFIFTWT